MADTEKKDGFLYSLNKFSGFLAMFSLVVIALFWIFNSGSTLTSLAVGQDQMIKTTSEITDALKEKTRDHMEFQKQEEFQNRLLLEQTKVLNRIAFTLDSLDKKLEK